MRYTDNQTQKQSIEWWLPGAGGGGREELLLKGYKVSGLHE
jgi:hypothetical protein